MIRLHLCFVVNYKFMFVSVVNGIWYLRKYECIPFWITGTQQVLKYHNGRVFFSFSNGEKCSSSGENYQLHVFLGCDYTLDTNQSRVTSYVSI